MSQENIWMNPGDDEVWQSWRKKFWWLSHFKASRPASRRVRLQWKPGDHEGWKPSGVFTTWIGHGSTPATSAVSRGSMVRVSSAKTRVGHGSATSQLHFQAPLIEERVEGVANGGGAGSQRTHPQSYFCRNSTHFRSGRRCFWQFCSLSIYGNVKISSYRKEPWSYIQIVDVLIILLIEVSPWSWHSLCHLCACLGV